MSQRGTNEAKVHYVLGIDGDYSLDHVVFSYVERLDYLGIVFQSRVAMLPE